MAGRRSQGGTPRRRADGRWEVRWTDGRGRRRSVYGATKGEVQAKLRDVLSDRDAGVSGDRTVLRAWTERHLTRAATAGLRQSTLDNYTNLLRLLPDGLLDRPVDRIAPEDVEDVLDGLLAKGYSGSTVASLRSLLCRVFDAPLRYGHLARNPARLTGRVRRDPQVPAPLDRAEAAALHAVAARDRLGTLITVGLLGLGLRKSEAIGLRWTDVDLDAGTVHVATQLTSSSAGQHRTAPKTAAGVRTIPLADVLAADLTAWRKQLAVERLASEVWQDHGLVWPRPDGRPLLSSMPNKLLDRLTDEAGLRHLTPHSLRHTAATWMLAAGVGERTILELLGQRDVAMVVRYQHVMPEVAVEAVDRFGAMLGEARGSLG